MAKKRVVRRRLADEDIESAVSYYLTEADIEIATAFLRRLEATIIKIARQPTAGSPRYGHELQIPDLRQWPIKQFPYLIFYIEREHHIEIARVLHSSRDIPASIAPDDTR